jgi:PKD repeat protein
MQMFFYNSPYHLGEWINGVVDGFLGIRIKINNLWHYGWIRMDVDVDAHKLTVKDFAYNLEAQKGIYTGQKDLFSHRFIEVSYNPSFCGNVIIYGRNNIPNLDYDKICRINSMGSLDSIGAVPATANPYFLYEDTNTVYSMMQYCVIPVTTDHIIGKSDTIASMYAQLSVDSNSNLVLSWTPYKNNDFSVYKVYKLDTSFGLSYGIDTVSNYMHSYTIPSTYVDSSNNEFYVIVNPFAHSNYVIRSTLANINPYHQIHPQAGFSYETLCTNCYYDFQFWDKSSANIKSWYWDFGDGSTSTHKNPWHSFSPGVWTVSLKVSNCFGEDSIVVQNAINVSSVESKVYDNNIEIFPNPVHNSLTIESKSQNPISHLRVISVEGKTVYERKNINMPIINLDMSSLAKGLYFVEIESNIGLLRKKIVLF